MIDNDNFYPTPLALTEKMFNKLGNIWKINVKYILEPSAGKGDLIENLMTIYNKKLSSYKCNAEKQFKIDVVEIDEVLRSTLRGKGYNLIHDDFLTFNPVRYYDLILANFPFSDGCKHLLKAIEIQERIGGRILCLINAQTLKNTYSNERKYLVEKLEEYNADIEYVEDAFINAERKTDVEVAIVYVDIPMKNNESMFEKEFKRDNIDIDFKNLNAVTTKMNKLQQLVFEYDLVIQSVTKLFEEKMRVDSLLSGFNLDSNISICNVSHNNQPIKINDFVEETNQRFWRKFIEETEFEGKLPTKLRDKFRSNMQKQRNISFSMDNVRYFYEELINAIPKSYEETIAEIFDKLTRQYNYSDREWNKTIWGYNGWKTNDCKAIRNKVIIPCYLSRNYYSYNIPEELIDLNIAFSNITGIDASEDFKHGSDIIKAISNAEKNIETSHFIISSYLKGTIHIKFKDKEALATFNYLASKGKNWLPPGFETKNYSDMTDNEKEIVKAVGFEPYQFNKLVLNQSKDYLKLLN